MSEIIERIASFRWWTDMVQKPPVLQQAYVGKTTGKIFWRDVPTVFEIAEPSDEALARSRT